VPEKQKEATKKKDLLVCVLLLNQSSVIGVSKFKLDFIPVFIDETKKRLCKTLLCRMNHHNTANKRIMMIHSA
jgi:hypothetical protein